MSADTDALVSRLIRERRALASQLHRAALPTTNLRAVDAAAKLLKGASGRFKSELATIGSWLQQRARKQRAPEEDLPQQRSSSSSKPVEMVLRRAALCRLLISRQYGLKGSEMAFALPDYYGEQALKKGTSRERLFYRDLKALADAGLLVAVGPLGRSCRYCFPDVVHLLPDVSDGE